MVLQLPQFPVQPLDLHQFVMGAALFDGAGLHDEDFVGNFEADETVSDDQGGASLNEGA